MAPDLLHDDVARAATSEAEQWSEAQLTLWATFELSFRALGVEHLVALDADARLVATDADGATVGFEQLHVTMPQPVYDAAERLAHQLRIAHEGGGPA